MAITQNGAEVATATETIPNGEIRTLTFDAVVRTYNTPSVIQIVPLTSAVTVDTLSVVIEGE